MNHTQCKNSFIGIFEWPQFFLFEYTNFLNWNNLHNLRIFMHESNSLQDKNTYKLKQAHTSGKPGILEERIMDSQWVNNVSFSDDSIWQNIYLAFSYMS